MKSIHLLRSRGAAGLAVLLAATALVSPRVEAGETARVSLDAIAEQGDGFSRSPSLSSDGRFVCFESRSTNLVPADRNGSDDIFVRDRATGKTTRVSVATSGVQGDSASFRAAISASGRFVAFVSVATNLTPESDGAVPGQIYLHDRESGATTIVSVNSQGETAAAFCDNPTLSADGRFVAFESTASNLVANDENNNSDVFVHDRDSGATTRVSVGPLGAESLGFSYAASISGDGQFVVFTSSAGDLVEGDGNRLEDVFLHDRDTGATSRVSVTSTGAEANQDSREGRISGNGRFVSFLSNATNLDAVLPDTNEATDVFVHDRKTGDTTRVSVDSAEEEGDLSSGASAISTDGRFVAIMTTAALVDSDGQSSFDVYLRDRKKGRTTLVSATPEGAAGRSPSYLGSVSGNGRFVSFTSLAIDLLPGANSVEQAYVRDVKKRTTSRVSVDSSNAEVAGKSLRPRISGNGRFVVFESEEVLVDGDTNRTTDILVRDLEKDVTTRLLDIARGAINPSISDNGRYVAFGSGSDQLVPDDTNGEFDVFVLDRKKGTVTRVSVGPDGAQADRQSFYPAISGNGRFVAFYSEATNFVEGGTGERAHVYVRDLRKKRTSLVSASSAGEEGDFGSDVQDPLIRDRAAPSISRNGRYVTFASFAGNLDADAPSSPGTADVFLHDVKRATTMLVSRRADGALANGESFTPAISGNGRFIAYTSFATDLVEAQTAANGQVYVYDRKQSTTTLASGTADGRGSDGICAQPVLSANGRLIAFASQAPLVDDDTNLRLDIYLRDRKTMITTRISVRSNGAQAGGGVCILPSITAKGRSVAFESTFSSLIEDDRNGANDIFVHDLRK